LRTRAERDGDDYVVNGQKVWTGTAHRAQWMFLLARTDPQAPKHRGISFLLLDMTTPGLSVRPLYSMAGGHSFNEEFFENVRIPRENLVGRENEGWYIGAALLDFERSNIGGAASARRTLADIVDVLRDTGGRAPEPIRPALAGLVVAAEVGRAYSYRIASIQARGGIPNHEASIAKMYHSEVAQRIAALGVQALGARGLLREGVAAPFALNYMTAVTFTVAGGTSEVQRNIIATRGLGLPR
jgi:alkylation response protein AidB-like acyl-CoA dehydrogenase